MMSNGVINKMLSHEKYSEQLAGILILGHHPHTLILANPQNIYNPHPPPSNMSHVNGFIPTCVYCRFHLVVFYSKHVYLLQRFVTISKRKLLDFFVGIYM